MYFDSIEDAGIQWLNKLLANTLKPKPDLNPTEHSSCLRALNKGDFWVTLDPYQSLEDTHFLHVGAENRLQWMGSLVDAELLEQGLKSNKLVKLQEGFRMPLAMIEHIGTMNVCQQI